MADSSSFWSDWVNNVTTVPKTQPAPTFNERFGSAVAPVPQQEDTDAEAYNNRNLPMWKRVGLSGPPSEVNPNDPRLVGGAYPGPRPNGPPISASQQPTIPIQTAQGAPQSPTQTLGGAPNSGMIGATPYSNQALTGGSGMPIGGLPTQSPAPDFNSPQQVNPQQMQLPPVSGPANPQFRMQQHQQNMQNFAKLLASLHGYNFLGQS